MAGRRVVQVLIGCCLLVSLVAPAGATIPADPGTEATVTEPPSMPGATDRTYQTESTNNTTRHTDPTATGEDGDIGRVKGWLAGRMGETLVDCTEGARAREFGICDLNESYPDRLSKYVNVTREQDDPDEDNATETFEDARDRQQTFNNQTQTFTTRLADYREARENGNTARARRLARQLRQIGGQINRTGESLDRTYLELSGQTGLNTTRARQNIDAVQLDVLETTAGLTDDLFVRTRLTVQTSAPNASFRDPLTLTGRLVTVDDTAIANRAIRIRLGTQTIQTRTNETGRFRLQYRPTTLPLDINTVTARYQPRADSVYLPANDTVSIALTQVTPAVTVTANRSTAKFRTPLSLSGTVTAAGVGASGVPVALTVGEQRVGTAQTDTTGRYQTRLRLPASVLDANRTVRARVALDEQALAPATATTPLRVRTTATNLTVTAAQTSARGVRVRGALATTDGTPLTDQRVTIRIGGDDITTVQTNATGGYTARVRLPDDVTGPVGLTLAGEFSGGGTNLQPARAITEFPAAPPEPETSTSTAAADETNESLLDWLVGILLTRWPLVGLLAGLVALGVGGYWAVDRWDPTGEPAGDGETVSATDSSSQVTVPEPGTEVTPSQSSPVDRARERIATGDVDAGIIAVYAMTRARLADRLDLEDGETHWEVVDRYRTAVDADAITVGSLSVDSALFEQLTEAYERAAFAPVSVSQASAETLLSDLVEPDDDQSSETQPGD